MNWQRRGRDRRRQAASQYCLLHVSAPDFAHALLLENGTCVEAPERLSAAIGMSVSQLESYFRRRGWEVEIDDY